MQQSSNSTIFYQMISILRRVNFSVTTAIFLLWLSSSSTGLAADKKPTLEEIPVNPLEITTPDPSLPRKIDDKTPLTSLERLKLAATLDELNRQAAAKLALGDRAGAFEIWNRELRLRRSLGLQEEVQALGRVGAIAWRENQQLQVQYITQRLQEIQKQAQSPPSKSKTPVSMDFKLLREIGVAYQQVRSPNLALEVYETILAAERKQQDQTSIEATLRTIAELHLAWFEYSKAAASYEELLSLARQKRDRPIEIAYMQQLAYIYEQANQYQQALAVKQQLAEIYRNQNQFTLLPQLRLEIGSNYAALEQLNQAFQNYQLAYTSAWSLQQYSRASDALRQLIALYRSQGQINEILQTSQILLQSEQLASDFYGMMNTYDQIGQIYIQQGNYPEALAAFQKGLELAQQLKYQEKHFAEQIAQVNQQISK